MFYREESYAFHGFCLVIERIDFPLTQQITLHRISFYLVLFLTYNQHNIK